MSDAHAAETLPPTPLAKGLSQDELLKLCADRFGAVRDPADRWALTIAVPAAAIRQVVSALRDDAALAFDTLVDLTGVDYLAYPGHRGARFAVIYNLKSTRIGHRIKIKVTADEDDARVPSIHDLFKIANWLERECWDQVGVVFTGHPNLKRLLNHHEFVGHPLRKDYPCQKRQKVSTNDPMLDQLEDRVRAKGFTIVQSVQPVIGAPMAGPRLEGAAK